MESIDQVLDRVFPQQITVTERVTMDKLAEIKTDVKKALPPNSTVEVTLLMNSILLSAYIWGEKKWYRRTCTANIT